MTSAWLAGPFEPAYNVRAFGAKGDGVTDDTVAIEAADEAAIGPATLGLDGVTVLSQGVVYFPPGVYKHTGLNYRGAPWQGAGENVTFLEHHQTGGPSVNAVGSNNARRLVNVSGMTFDGSNAARGATGWQLGFNQRSMPAMKHVRIQNYPSWGIFFAANNWMLSFYDVYLWRNGRLSDGALSVDRSAAFVGAIDWFNLSAETNGTVRNRIGAIELNGSAGVWNFHGGTWEGNFGAAEARFIDCEGIHLYGTYLESDGDNKVGHGLIIGGETTAVLSGIRNVAEDGKIGAAFRCIGNCNVSIDNPVGHRNWPVMLSVEDDARVSLLSEGSKFAPITVTDNAAFLRATPKIVQLDDVVGPSGEPSIQVDATHGTVFRLELGSRAGVRTIGAPINASPGQQLTFIVTHNGNTAGSNVVFESPAFRQDPAASIMSQSGGGGCFSFIYDGRNWHQRGG